MKIKETTVNVYNVYKCIQLLSILDPSPNSEYSLYIVRQ